MAVYLRLRAAISSTRRYHGSILSKELSLVAATYNNNCVRCKKNNYYRCMTVYGFGQQWSGALSRGSTNLYNDEAPELSPEELQQFVGEYQNMISLKGIKKQDEKCLGASVGWGHTALLVGNNTKAAGSSSSSKATTSTTDSSSPKLMICGRPHDFQTLMRLRRLPPFMRNFCIKHTAPTETDDDHQHTSLEPSMLQRIASYFAGENEATFYEEECRRYSNVPTLLEIDLPNNEIPALEGEELDNRALESHSNEGRSNVENNIPSSFHIHFQNTLATSAGITAIISKTGHLYTFGLNHRGQCGVGSYTPNIWTPSQVSGLANNRFILDQLGSSDMSGEDMYKNFKDQQHSIVSVALGLQHGVALDSDGQVFCWGKGERGQLGQGRRLIHEEGYNNDDNNELSEEDNNKVNNESTEEDAPNESRTFEYALHVSNFYDPHATISSSPSSSIVNNNDNDNMMYAPLLSKNDSKVRLISAGMNFSLAVTNSNLPYIWGKNVCINPSYSQSGLNIRTKPVLDSTYPRYIPGLPPNLRIERVACGTHHATFLLEDGSIWAVGIATDTPIPLWDEAVEILASGVVNMNELISFNAGFDRTTVVSRQDERRRQVIEVQLWSNEELRMQGAVRPSWVDWLENEKGDDEAKKVCSVHRGWMHTVVVTED